MIIKNASTTDQPFSSGVLNTNFFGVSSSATSTVQETVTIQPPPYERTLVVTPPPYTSDVYIQPPAIVQTIDGLSVTVTPPPIKQSVTVQPPPISQEVTITPPAYTTVVTKSGSTVSKNQFESVGVVQTWPYRLTALVKPNVIAAALHYSLPIGAKVRFYTSKGFEERTVRSVAATFFDLQLYYLDAAVTAVQPAQILNQTDTIWYRGKTVVTFGLIGSRSDYSNWIPAAFRNGSIRTVGQVSMADYSVSCLMSSTTFMLEPGDSGSPSFILDNNQYYFLGSTRKIASATYEVNAAFSRLAVINSL
jgi:hypothetical protein